MPVKHIQTQAQKDYLNYLKNMKSPQAKVGIIKANTYPSGEHVAYIATIQEFGSPKNNIPPRPFFRTTIAEKVNEWRSLIQKGAASIKNGSETMGTVLEKVASLAAGQIKKKITEINSPPLKPSTVKARLRGKKVGKSVSLSVAKPLIDTGQMLNSIEYTVEEK